MVQQKRDTVKVSRFLMGREMRKGTRSGAFFSYKMEDWMKRS